MCIKYKKMAKGSMRPFDPVMSQPYIIIIIITLILSAFANISQRNLQCQALAGGSSRANSACCFMELLQFIREEVVCKVPLSGLKVECGG